MLSQASIRERNRRADERTAVHEAGHAVVGAAVGFTPTRMWIADDGAGYCEFTDLPLDHQITTFETLDRVLTCDLGGPVAACLWDGDDPRRAARQMLELERTSHTMKPIEIATRIFERKGYGHDHARLEAFRLLDQTIPAATEYATNILNRSWDAVLCYAATLGRERAARIR